MIILFIFPIIAVIMVLGWVHLLLMESHRLQAEWVQLWQQMVLEQSIARLNLTIPVLHNCQEANHDNGLIIHGDHAMVLVHKCNGQWMINMQ